MAGTDDAVARLIQAGRDREAAQRGLDLNGGPMDTLTQFGHVGALLGGVVGNLTDADLDRPTPCAEFTVRGVLEHMITGATAFAAAYRGEEAPEPSLDDVLANFGPALENLGAAVSAPGALNRTVAAPFGEVPGDTFARFVVLDGLIHGWDLATATGQPYDPPDELVTEVDAFARNTLEPLRGQGFDDAVEPAADASPIECLAAYTGRRPLAGADQ